MPATPAKDMTTADHTDESATTALYRSAIGPINTGYYLPVFTHFEAMDRAGIRWNWAASLCTLNWMAYRQLWIAALAYVGAVVAVALMVFGIGRLIFQFSTGVELGLLLGFGALAFVVPGLYGNALFHAECRKKMAQALAATTTVPEACTLLQQKASSRQRLIWLALINALVIGAALGVYAMFPLSVSLPDGVDKPAPTRNLAVGRATDATQEHPVVGAIPASAPARAASTPVPASAASAPAPAASTAPVAAPRASAPATSTAAATPAPVASAPASARASAPALATSAPTHAQVRPPASSAAANKVATAPKAASAPVAPKAAASAPAAVAVSKAAKAAKAAQANAVAAEPRYFINVGLFAEDNNALNAYVKLIDAGLPAFKQELNTSKGKRTRVRVGPFDSEPEAQRAVEKIQALGLDALVFQK